MIINDIMTMRVLFPHGFANLSSSLPFNVHIPSCCELNNPLTNDDSALRTLRQLGLINVILRVRLQS